MISLNDKIVRIESKHTLTGLSRFGYEFENEEGEIETCNTLSNKKFNITSIDIIKKADKFSCGYKLVKLSDQKYSYLRKDGRLMAYRYDVASEFNKNGLAMVAKDGLVNWINANFNYYDYNSKSLVKDKITNDEFNGFQEVNDFSTGKHKLSRVILNKKGIRSNIYLETNLLPKEFRSYDGSVVGEGTTLLDLAYGDFKDQDILVSDHGIIYSKGFYVPIDALLKECINNGTVDKFTKEINSKRLIKK